MRLRESLGGKELSIGEPPAREMVETAEMNQANPELFTRLPPLLAKLPTPLQKNFKKVQN
jgi:hypothetical protein